MAKKTKMTGPTPVDAIKHKESRVNIPTEELRDKRDVKDGKVHAHLLGLSRCVLRGRAGMQGTSGCRARTSRGSEGLHSSPRPYCGSRAGGNVGTGAG